MAVQVHKTYKNSWQHGTLDMKGNLRLYQEGSLRLVALLPKVTL